MTNTLKTSSKKLKYKVELDQLDNKHKANGDTLLEAIENLGLTWNDIKLKGNLTVKYGKQRAEKLYYLPLLKKLFFSRPYRIMQAKWLEKLLK